MTKHRRQAPWLRALSAVTVIGARRVLSLQREPHLALFLSLSTNKDVYYFTSPALLPISFMWYSATNATFNTGETKRHLTDRDAPSQQHIDQPPQFQITLPFLPILWTTWNSFLSNSSPQRGTLFARQEKHFWSPRVLNLLGYTCVTKFDLFIFFVSVLVCFIFFSIFVNQSCHIYFLQYHLKFCNRFIHVYLASM